MPDDTQINRVLDALCRKGRPIILKYFDRDSCIGSTNIAMRVLGRFRIPSRSVPVSVVAFNAKADEFMRAGHPEWVREQRDGAYSVGIDGHHQGPNPHKWDGHVVLLVADQYVLDMSADQMTRASRGIFLSPFFARADGFEGGTGMALLLKGGGIVVYKADMGNRYYLRTPDWLRTFDAEVEEVFHAVSEAVLEAEART